MRNAEQFWDNSAYPSWVKFVAGILTGSFLMAVILKGLSFHVAGVLTLASGVLVACIVTLVRIRR